MFIAIRQDNVSVDWNDDEDKYGKPDVVIKGMIVQCNREDLKDLYDCLDFLFGTKNESNLRQV